MGNGVSAGGALLPTSTRDHPFDDNAAVGAGEGKVHQWGGFEDKLLPLRTLGEASVERLKRKVGLNFHP